MNYSLHLRLCIHASSEDIIQHSTQLLNQPLTISKQGGFLCVNK
jgi:hypothetical protein